MTLLADARKPFTIGDSVRPIAAWRDGWMPPIPSGLVRKAEPFGRGQLLWIGDDRRPYIAGIFERDGEA